MIPVVLDLETTVSTTYGRRCNQIDGSNRVIALILGVYKQPTKIIYDKDGIDTNTKLELDPRKHLLVGHNFKFDLLFLWKNESIKQFFKDGGQIYDTQIAEYLLTGQQAKFSSLPELQHKYCGEQIKDDVVAELFNEGYGADEIDKDLLLKYCETDRVGTELVFIEQYKRAKKLKMLPLLRVWNDYLLSMVEQEYNGVFLDVSKTQDALLRCDDKLAEIKSIIHDKVHPFWDKSLPEFNFNSKHHLSALVFGGKLPKDKKTKIQMIDDNGEGVFFKNGNPKMVSVQEYIEFPSKFKPQKNWHTKNEGVYKVDEGVLSSVAKQDNNDVGEIIKILLKYRKLEKIRGTYLQPYLELLHPDSCIHTNYNATATDTGRISSSKPNMQNPPASMKNMFKSRFEGGKILDVDFSSLEVRIQAQLTGCVNLKKDLDAGIDFHTLRLSYAEGLDYEECKKLVDEEEEWQLKRKKAKAVSFSKAYGAGVPTIAKNSGLSEEVVEEIFANEDRRYPEISAWLKKVEAYVNRSVRITDRVLPFRIKRKPGEYKYFDHEKQHKGCWRSDTGMLWVYKDRGVMTHRGPFRHWSTPEMRNYAIQGTAAFIQAIACGLLFRNLVDVDGVLFVAQTHDSSTFDVRPDKIDWTKDRISDIIKEIPKYIEEKFDIKWDVELPIDFTVDDYWG